MTDLREQIAQIVREAIHAGYKDGLKRWESNVYQAEPPAEHYADRILALMEGERIEGWVDANWQFYEAEKSSWNASATRATLILHPETTDD